MNILKKNKTQVLLVLFAIIMSFFCIGSSPILDYMDPDSQNYWLIGRSLASGQVAYKDIFDHKGLYIFLINELAALIYSNSDIALFFIESIAYSIDILLVYKIIHKVIANQITAMLSSMAFLGVSFNFFTFVTGNLTESWSMLFQLISLYYIEKYYLDNTINHPPFYMFVHGLCGCIVGFIRPNNAGMWVIYGVVLAYRLIRNKKLINFFQNLLTLITGILVGAIPLLYYGVRYDCFSEIWYGIFEANMNYSANTINLSRFFHFITLFVTKPAVIIILLGIISIVIMTKKYKCNKDFVLAFILMFLGSLFFMNITMNPFQHYYHICTIFVIPAITCFFYYFEKYLKVYIWISVIILLTLLSNMQLVKQLTKYGTFHHFYTAARDIENVLEEYPSGKIIVAGCNSVFYNETHTLPHIRYFITYGAGLSYENFPDATLQQMESILSGENDYVIIASDDDNSIYKIPEIDKKIYNYLSSNYDVIYNYDNEFKIKLYEKAN